MMDACQKTVNAQGRKIGYR